MPRNIVQATLLCEFISDLAKIPDWKSQATKAGDVRREGEESGFAESDYATLIVPADGGEKKKMEENKKGDSKGSGRAEPGAGGKEGTTSGANGTKIKQEGGDGGSKRLVSLIELKSTVRSIVVQQTGNVSLTTLLGMFYCCITVSSG